MNWKGILNFLLFLNNIIRHVKCHALGLCHMSDWFIKSILLCDAYYVKWFSCIILMSFHLFYFPFHISLFIVFIYHISIHTCFHNQTWISDHVCDFMHVDWYELFSYVMSIYVTCIMHLLHFKLCCQKCTRCTFYNEPDMLKIPPCSTIIHGMLCLLCLTYLHHRT